MKKKLLAALLSCAMLGTLLMGCGSADSSTASTTTSTATEADDASGAKVYLI